MTRDVTIVPLTLAAIDQVFLIEQEAGDTRWSRAQFEKETFLPMSRFFVLQEERNILGYGGYWKVDDEAQITNMVIAPRRQRQGLGSLLLKYLLEKAGAEGCHVATLEVRSRNQAAKALYDKAGFTLQGRRPGAYTEPADEAILMEKQL